MTIQHKSLRDEVLFIIGRATAPLSCNEIYERCELADEVDQVSKSVWSLKNEEKIVRVEGEGRARYKLATGIAAPAPAGKEGRSKAVQKDDAAAAQPAPLTGIRPDAEPARPAPAAAADDEISKGLDLVEARLKDERLADAIIARLKLQLAPTLCELEAAVGMDRLNVHIHIEQVDFHLGGL